jgi:hypothetical protein
LHRSAPQAASGLIAVRRNCSSSVETEDTQWLVLLG